MTKTPGTDPEWKAAANAAGDLNARPGYGAHAMGANPAFMDSEPTDFEMRAHQAAQGSSVHPFDGGQPRHPVAQRKTGPDLEDRAANRNAVIADQDAELRARQAGKPHSDSYTRSRRTFREDDLDDEGGWGDSADAERYYYGYDPSP